LIFTIGEKTTIGEKGLSGDVVCGMLTGRVWKTGCPIIAPGSLIIRIIGQS